MAMKIYEVIVGDKVYTVGRKEMEYLALVFGKRAKIVEKVLPDQQGSDTMVCDD